MVTIHIIFFVGLVYYHDRRVVFSILPIRHLFHTHSHFLFAFLPFILFWGGGQGSNVGKQGISIAILQPNRSKNLT